MRIFISWSGPLSRELAEALWSWLSRALHHTQPYFTPKDIESGARWFSEVASELAESNYGLLCLTRENLESPWIMFEAGALSKQLEEARVCAILFDDLTPEDLKGPLGVFQSVRFQETDFWQLFQSINVRCGSGRLSDFVLQDVFKKWWPPLQARLGEITRKYRAAQPVKAGADQVLEETLLVVKRRDHDIRLALEMLEELLALNRHNEPGKVRTTTLDASALQDLTDQFLSLKSSIAGCALTEVEEIKSDVRAVAASLRRFVVLGIPDEKTRNDLISKLDGVAWDLEAGDQNWGGSG